MALETRQSNNQEAETAKTALEQFFSVENVYASPLAGQVSNDKQIVPTSLVPAIMRYAKGLKDCPVLLPFAAQQNERTYWLACAHDELSARSLQDEMAAFIGPSFGEFEFEGAVLSGKQVQIKSKLIQSGLHVIGFFAVTPNFESRVIASWQRYWQLLELRPERPRQDLRTFHQLRAAFDRALVARNEKDALAVMAALRDQHGLSAENRAFLEIRLHAALGRWDRILAHPQWDDLLKIRLPPETYGDIWDALYETYLAPVEVLGIAEDLIRAFAQKVRVMAAPLLKGRGRSRRPSALKGFLLHELSLEQASTQLCSTLLQEMGPGAFGPISEAIASIVRQLQPKSGPELAIHEMDLERYEQALVLLLPLPDSIEVLQAQLRCAKEIGNPTHASATINRINSASAEIAEKVRQARPRLLADVEKLASLQIPESALQAPNSAQSPVNADDTLVYWRELVHSAQATDLVGQPSFVQSMTTTIEDIALDASPLFESLLPIWFDWLIIRCQPSSAMVRVYLGFIEALHVRDRAGESEREMIRLATRHALIAGLTPVEYMTLVDRLSSLLSETPSPREISWALDLSDLLLVQPCRDEEIRLRWVTRVLQAAFNVISRLSEAERCLLEYLAREANFTLPTRVDRNDETTLENRSSIENRIFLYSLDTQAIRRAARVLEEVFPKAKIDFNSDETCTTRLKSGSRNADWVVFVSGVATHQAFYCIKGGMRPESTLLQVEGTGTTRIVERVIRQSQSAGLLPVH
jgi:hypothetical protein